MRRFLRTQAIVPVVFSVAARLCASSSPQAPTTEESAEATGTVTRPGVAVEIAKFLVLNVEQAVTTTESTESTATQDNIDATTFVNKFIAFMTAEQRIFQRYEAQGRRLNRRIPRPDPLMSTTQRQQVMRRVCAIVEKKEVSLVVASRLVKRPWSPSMDDNNARGAQRFVKNTLKAWIVQDLTEGTIQPPDARAVLSNCAIMLRRDEVSIVGGLAETALKDIEHVERPDALISLMWAVHATSVHGTREFWSTAINRLIFLNTELRGRMQGVMEEDDGATLIDGSSEEKKVPRGRNRRPEVGHVFSGLTTRQIYRLLEVLKRVKWNGNVGELRDLADQALKNIVFETEAAAFDAVDANSPDAHQPLERSILNKRIQHVADLDSGEFLKLLSISADFGIPFNVSAARVSEHLLAPMIRFLDAVQLLEVMQIARKTGCTSPSLLISLANKIQERGPNAPYALPLSKALVRTSLTEAELVAQTRMIHFYRFFLRVSGEQCTKVRGEELCGVAEILYGLSRRFAPASEINHEIKTTIDLFCRQLNRLLQLDLISPRMATRLLEQTIVLGMRNEPEVYSSVTGLLNARNAVMETIQNRAIQRREQVSNTPEDAGSPKRWEDRAEEDLPQQSKAAVLVYNELIYMFERMAVVKASLGSKDFARFEEAFEKTGLFNVLVGARLMKFGHLDPSTTVTSAAGGHKAVRAAEPSGAGGAADVLPAVLPGWMEKRVHHILVRRIRKAAITETSSDEDVLKLLGQVHCDEKKVHEFVALARATPFRMLAQQRDLWLFAHELARRFGTPEVRKVTESEVSKALF